MAISQDPSAPLVVVVGATGAQGGSVIKNLADSDKPYRIRGFTRDTGGTGARDLTSKGVNMVEVNPTVENKDQVFKAFEGATYAFAVTKIASSKDQETAEGKMFVDAAKAANVKLLVWSGLPDVTKRSGGKYVHVGHFDSKAAVTVYAKASGVPYIDVQAGAYFQNYTTMYPPIKQPDGTFTLFVPAPPDALWPLFDCSEDYGVFVRRAIEEPLPSGTELHAHAEMIPLKQLAKTLSEITGRVVNYVQATEEQFKQGMAGSGLSSEASQDIYEAFKYISEFGFWGNGDEHFSLRGLGRTPRTWAEFVKATDWSKILA